MRKLLFMPLLVVLLGCPGVKRTIVRPVKDPPQLRTRPLFNGPHYEVQTACIKKVDWYEGWCENGTTPGELICHDVRIVAPPSCITVSAKAVQ
jgi:hypothetical protein